MNERVRAFNTDCNKRRITTMSSEHNAEEGSKPFVFGQSNVPASFETRIPIPAIPKPQHTDAMKEPTKEPIKERPKYALPSKKPAKGDVPAPTKPKMSQPSSSTRDYITGLERENEQLRGKGDTEAPQRTRIQSLEDTVKNLEEQLQQEKVEKAKLGEENERLQNNRAAVIERAVTAEKHVTESEAAFNELEEKWEKKWENLKKSDRGQVSAADRNTKAARDELQAIKNQLQTQREHYTRKIDELREDNALLNEQLDQRHEYLQSAENNEGDQARIKALVEAKEKWEQSTQGLEDDAARLRAMVNEKDNTITNLQAKIQQQEQSIIDIEATNEQNVTLMKEEIKNLKGMRDGLLEAIDDLEHNYTTDEDAVQEEASAPLGNDVGLDDFSSVDDQGGDSEPTITVAGVTSKEAEPFPAESKPETAIPEEPTPIVGAGSGAEDLRLPAQTQEELEELAVATTPLPAEVKPAEVATIVPTNRWFSDRSKRIFFGFGVLLLAAVALYINYWAWNQGKMAKQERNMWMLGNDRAQRLPNEILRKQAIALLQATEKRESLGWLTPVNIRKLHATMFSQKFKLAPTPTIRSVSQTAAVAGPTPAQFPSFPAWNFFG